MKKVFVFGAGASLHAGAPLGNNFLNKYIELKLHLGPGGGVLYGDSLISRILDIQPNRKFSIGESLKNIQRSNLPNIEDVFTLFDIANEKEEPFLYESEGDLTLIRREDFIDLIRYTLHYSIKNSLNDYGTTEIYQKFVEQLENDDAVISFNYDTLLDNAVKHKFKDLNYGFEITPIRDFIDLTGRTWKNVVNESNCLDTDINLSFKSEKPPLLLKPHGSLNWLYCPKCYNFFFLLGTKIYDYLPYFYECPHSLNAEPSRRPRLIENIVPLTHLKNFKNPIYNVIWMKIVQQLSKADKIYFIGYSLPDADFISKYYFIKGLHRAVGRNNVKIILINPNIKNEDLGVKFEKLFGNRCGTLDFNKKTFTNWINSFETKKSTEKTS